VRDQIAKARREEVTEQQQLEALHLAGMNEAAAHGYPAATVGYQLHTDTAAELRAALEQSQNHVLDAVSMVPDGWKLVPVKPTDAMLGAGLQHVDGMASMPLAYRAMIDAAPQPPTTEQPSAVEKLQVEQEPVAEHELKDVRCECCGYMTHHREHMGCIRAAHTKREPLTDDQVLKAVRHLYQSDSPIGMGFSDDLDVARAIEAAHNIK
jgi:hypothetical protein